MLSGVHIRIGRTVAGELKAQNLRLSRKAFIVGNVFPDFLPHFPGHNQIKSEKLFGRLHTLLLNRHKKRKERIKMVDSFLLGVLSHYAADYACSAHQENYTENMRRHVRYERDMSRFLKGNPQVLCRTFASPEPQQNQPLAKQIVFCKTDNFADELVHAVDAVRLVCATAY